MKYKRADEFDGLVPCISKAGRVLLHLLHEGDLETTRTLCGRYGWDRILPAHTKLRPDTPECQVCSACYSHGKAQR